MLNCVIITAKLNFLSKGLRKCFWVVPIRFFSLFFYNEKQAHLKAFIQPDLTQLRVVLKIMSRWFSFYFRVCFCKLKKEHSGLCDWWDLTKWHRKGRKATETEDTRKGKNLNPEFLEPPLKVKKNYCSRDMIWLCSREKVGIVLSSCRWRTMPSGELM